ncbi:hypothetical protein [Xanthobacter oligotrophicus]|uniref:hypothetical protein n=1 Tax=Xanthobacter oligotrophicus TaxID=2607286 RepID=UPI0011F28B9A|nr:hypothetical protein [Xanthobacter oligotrophicus]MCG5235975.1 hypothetical protein [Xanthobacter oligotrophicus]
MPDAASFPPCPAPRAMRFAPVGRRPSRAVGALAAGLAALLLAAFPLAGSAQAQSAAAKKEDTSCAQYGAGFQKVPGGTSCVRTGATVRAEGFSGTALTGAPNQFGGTPSGSGTTATDTSDPWKSAR